MKTTLEKYLKENIDAAATVKLWEERTKLPLFLLETYSFYSLTLLGESCLLMEITGEVPAIDMMLKHMRVIRKSHSDSLVFLFKSISAYKRKILIEQRIPFLIDNGQMYLPFLGLNLKKETEQHITAVEEFSATAQLVYLYFLYDQELKINATELSKCLHVTKMTASRALKELYDLGLLKYHIGGKNERSKEYQRINDPEYYQRGNGYLKNPIIKVAYIKEFPEAFPLAGLAALANRSMINHPNWTVRAISKDKAKFFQDQMKSEQEILFKSDYDEVQIWRYDPGFLGKDNQVDKLSLALSFKKNKDDRINQAIDEMLEGEPWYKE